MLSLIICAKGSIFWHAVVFRCASNADPEQRLPRERDVLHAILAAGLWKTHAADFTLPICIWQYEYEIETT